MNRCVTLLVVFLPAIAAGCINVRYRPELTLDLSPETVRAKVEFVGLEDASPPEDREGGTFVGVCCTRPGTLEGELRVGVTNAILRDFRDNQVFVEIEKRMTGADLVLEGRIRRFTAQSRLNWYGWATLPIHYLVVGWFWYIPVPIQNTWGIVDLELVLRLPDGTALGTYQAKREFNWTHTYYNSRWAQFSCPTQLNTLFNDVVQDIRGQILADRISLEIRVAARRS